MQEEKNEKKPRIITNQYEPIEVESITEDFKGKLIMEPTHIDFVIEKYPTHVLKYQYKREQKDDKYFKVNGQGIYNGSIRDHVRKKVMYEIHQILSRDLPSDLDLSKYLPGSLAMFWYTIPNHEGIRMIKGGKVKIPDYSSKVLYDPCFDAFNQNIWIKAFEDTMVKDLQLIPDDSVKYLPDTGRIIYHPIQDFNKRKLVFRLKKIPFYKRSTWLRFFNYWP